MKPLETPTLLWMRAALLLEFAAMEAKRTGQPPDPRLVRRAGRLLKRVDKMMKEKA